MSSGLGRKDRERLEKLLQGDDPDELTEDEVVELDETWGTSDTAQAEQAKMMAWAGGEG